MSVFEYPDNKLFVDLDSYPNLSKEFIYWFDQIATLDVEGTNPFEKAYTDSIYSLLKSYDSLAKILPTKSSFFNPLVLLIIDGKPEFNLHLSFFYISPERHREAFRDIRWAELKTNPLFVEAFKELLDSGFLNRFFELKNVPSEILELFHLFNHDERYNYYRSWRVSIEQIAYLERITSLSQSKKAQILLHLAGFPFIVTSGTMKFEKVTEFLRSFDTNYLSRNLVVLLLHAAYPKESRDFLTKIELTEYFDLVLQLFQPPLSVEELANHIYGDPSPSNATSQPIRRVCLEYRDDLILAIPDTQKILEKVLQTLEKKLLKSNIKHTLDSLFIRKDNELISNVLASPTNLRNFSLLLEILSDFIIEQDNELQVTSEWLTSYLGQERSERPRTILLSNLTELLLQVYFDEGKIPFGIIFVKENFHLGGGLQVEHVQRIVDWIQDSPINMYDALTLKNVSKWEIRNLIGWIDQLLGVWIEKQLSDDKETSWEKRIIYQLISDTGFSSKISVFDHSKEFLSQFAQSTSEDDNIQLILKILRYFEIKSGTKIEPFQIGSSSFHRLELLLSNPTKTIKEIFLEDCLTPRSEAWNDTLWLDLGVPKEMFFEQLFRQEFPTYRNNLLLSFEEMVRKVKYLTPNMPPDERMLLLCDMAIASSTEDMEPYLSIVIDAFRLEEKAHETNGEELGEPKSIDASNQMLIALRRLSELEERTKALHLSSLPSALTILLPSKDLWYIFNALLQAFRNLEIITIKEDLAPVPELRFLESRIPMEITKLIRIADSKGVIFDIRRSLAISLSDKLKPYKGNPEQRNLIKPNKEIEGYDPSITEPDPRWRSAYIRSLQDLGIKEKGKGHFLHAVLKNVAEKDPSKEVRELALEAFKELDRQRTGVSAGSDKRLVFYAWWWLRKAHRYCLGGDIDEKESIRTRNTEFR